MADTETTNFNLVKPEVGGSTDTWGGKLNDNLDIVDGQLKTNQDAAATAATAAGTSFDNTASGLTATNAQAAIDELAAEVFPSGTRMLFQQTAAPTGWTKVTTGIDNRALRVVTGTAGSGGANAFTTAFNSNRTTSIAGAHAHTITVNNHTLSIAQIPNRTGAINGTVATRFGASPSGVFAGSPIADRGASTGLAGGAGVTSANFNLGGSGSAHAHGASSESAGNHAHTLNLDVQYLDVIVAVKN